MNSADLAEWLMRFCGLADSKIAVLTGRLINDDSLKINSGEISFDNNSKYIWEQCLYKRGLCRLATLSPAYSALAEMDAIFNNGVSLITSNIDGLHKRAGNKRVYEINGNINYYRDHKECIYPLPSFGLKHKGGRLTNYERLITSGNRPHILLGGEGYDPGIYNTELACNAIHEADLLIYVGVGEINNLIERAIAGSKSFFSIGIGGDEKLLSRYCSVFMRGGADNWLPWVSEVISIGLLEKSSLNGFADQNSISSKSPALL